MRTKNGDKLTNYDGGILLKSSTGVSIIEFQHETDSVTGLVYILQVSYNFVTIYNFINVCFWAQLNTLTLPTGLSLNTLDVSGNTNLHGTNITGNLRVQGGFGTKIFNQATFYDDILIGYASTMSTLTSIYNLATFFNSVHFQNTLNLTSNIPANLLTISPVEL